MKRNDGLNKKLLDLKSTLPATILADHFKLRPDMALRYTEHQKTHFKNDIAWILSFLAESVWTGEAILFDEFVSWLRTFLSSVKVPMKDVAESFALLKNRLANELDPDEFGEVSMLLDNATGILLASDHSVSLPAAENFLTPMAESYLKFLLAGKKDEALSLIMGQIKGGMAIQKVYLEVFQPVQYEIGRLWQSAKINVAQEHYCTAATQLVMSQLYPYLFTGEKKDRRLIVACVPNELHEMGARMVADFFEMNGWDTYYLGANTPVESIVRFVAELKPDCLAVSATMTYHVSMVHQMILAVRSMDGISNKLKILVGGYPFKIAKELWKSLGADGFAHDATDAVGLANRLILTS